MFPSEALLDEDEILNEYRSSIVSAEQKAQEDFDKTVLYLSGGALGISFAFVKDIVGERPPAGPWLLAVGWMAWALSATSVLTSYLTSLYALRTATGQVDDRSILRQTPGGKFTTLTQVLNGCGGLLFVAGVAAMGVFVYKNLQRVP
jgi:hypothetical protein